MVQMRNSRTAGAPVRGGADCILVAIYNRRNLLWCGLLAIFVLRSVQTDPFANSIVDSGSDERKNHTTTASAAGGRPKSATLAGSSGLVSKERVVNGESYLGGTRWTYTEVYTDQNKLKNRTYHKPDVFVQGYYYTPPRQPKTTFGYKPSALEEYYVENGVAKGYDEVNPLPKTCTDWTNQSSSPIYEDLQAYRKKLADYERRVEEFPGLLNATNPDHRYADLRAYLRKHSSDSDPYAICKSLELHPEGLEGIFPGGVLSDSTPSSGGLLEPILPPLRSPEYCFEKRSRLLSMEYLVHDFAAYCRKLTPHSRTVLVDMGAALEFHSGEKDKTKTNSSNRLQPAVYLTEIFGRFGFLFDHIYAFELSAKNTSEVFEQVPKNLLNAYHWMNIGVDPDPKGKTNPWNMLLETFTEEDFVVVKLDIDSSWIEMPLVVQLLENPKIAKLVDSFYFEHHVYYDEISMDWKASMNGTLHSSVMLFHELRRRGVAAHSWV